MTAAATSAPRALDIEAVKKDFAVLAQPAARGARLVFLDSAASSQKPDQVLDAMTSYYGTTHANVHRGVYAMAEEATARYEGARAAVGRFIGAADSREVIFTKNGTEALNLVAKAWGRAHLAAGDVVVLTEMEHHANLVPWLMLKDEIGVELRYIGIDDAGYLDLSNLDRILDRARLVSFTAASNVLGTLTPVRRIADAAHAAGALVVLDACQYVPHLACDVAAMGADFVAFTGHKMLGPTGIGVLWGRAEVLEDTPPFLGGGDMICDVRLDGFTPNELPWKFEAGTPPIAEAVGLAAAVDYLEALGMGAVRQHEIDLTAYALDTLRGRFGDAITIYGPTDVGDRGGVVSFTFRSPEGLDVHPHDVSQVLDQSGICIRAGHHCAKPLMRRLGVGATARASMYVYNDRADVDALADGLGAAAELFC